MATLSIVLRLDGFYPVSHLLVELLESPKLQIVLFLHVVSDYCAYFIPFLFAFSHSLFFSLLCIKDSLLLREIGNESSAIGISQQTQEIIDLVQDQQLDMGLHPYAIDQLLLFLNERVARVAPNLLDFSHFYPLLCLLYCLPCKVEHVF